MHISLSLSFFFLVLSSERTFVLCKFSVFDRNVDILGFRKRTVHASCLLTANQLAVCFGEACLPVYATQTRPAKRPVKRLTRGCDSHPREPDFSGLEPATRTQVGKTPRGYLFVFAGCGNLRCRQTSTSGRAANLLFT